MPIWMRKFHINKMNEWFKKVEKEREPSQDTPTTNISKPNIDPSSTYNFNK